MSRRSQHLSTGSGGITANSSAGGCAKDQEISWPRMPVLRMIKSQTRQTVSAKIPGEKMGWVAFGAVDRGDELPAPGRGASRSIGRLGPRWSPGTWTCGGHRGSGLEDGQHQAPRGRSTCSQAQRIQGHGTQPGVSRLPPRWLPIRKADALRRTRGCCRRALWLRFGACPSDTDRRTGG
jgi:hypothetical protein